MHIIKCNSYALLPYDFGNNNTINCIDDGEDCYIECWERSCKDKIINCVDNRGCTVQCGGDPSGNEACQNSTIYGNDAIS